MAEQFSFLQQFVQDVLMQHGFDKLTEEDRQAYFPQFVGEAERRVGLVLLPLIKTKADGDEMEKLLASGGSPEAWSAFWHKAVPNFEDVVRDALNAFSKEVAASFS
jgi:hypothetical protein